MISTFRSSIKLENKITWTNFYKCARHDITEVNIGAGGEQLQPNANRLHRADCVQYFPWVGKGTCKDIHTWKKMK